MDRSVEAALNKVGEQNVRVSGSERNNEPTVTKGTVMAGGHTPDKAPTQSRPTAGNYEAGDA
jgi:hypothetical protein